MLSLIKAHCFKIKGDWYLVFPYGESSDSWFLPTRSLRRYIAFEVIAAFITIGLIGLFCSTVVEGGFLMAGASLLAAGSFFAHYFLLRYVMLALGARPSPYRMWSLKVRGHMHAVHFTDPDLPPIQRYVQGHAARRSGGHMPVHLSLVVWLVLVILTVLGAWRLTSEWQAYRPFDFIGLLFVIGAPLAAWGLIRFQKYLVRNISLADIDPPPQ